MLPEEVEFDVDVSGSEESSSAGNTNSRTSTLEGNSVIPGSTVSDSQVELEDDVFCEEEEAGEDVKEDVGEESQTGTAELPNEENGKSEGYPALALKANCLSGAYFASQI